MDKRIPSLDGIRAVAIFLVIVLHIGQHYHWPTAGTTAYKILIARGGAIWSGDGVGIFFVLSGFLITTLLLREFAKSGDIAVGPFYLRRRSAFCLRCWSILLLRLASACTNIFRSVRRTSHLPCSFIAITSSQMICG